MIEGRGLTKRFGGVVALDAVDIRVEPGRVTALLGENGAGKSTLVACLSGAYRPDQGELRLAGAPVRFRAPERRPPRRHRGDPPGAADARGAVGGGQHLSGAAGAGRPTDRGLRDLNARAAAHLAALGNRRPRPGGAHARHQGARIASWSRSPARWSTSPKCCSSTSPMPAWRGGIAAAVRRGARPARAGRRRGADQPQAARGVFDRRPHRDHARRPQGGRCAPSPSCGRARHRLHTGGARPMGPAASASVAAVANDDRPPLLELSDFSGPGFAHVSFAIGAGEIVGMSGLVGSGRTEIAHAVIGRARRAGA